MVENRKRTIKNKYTLGSDFGSLNRRAVLVSVKEDS